EEIPLGSRIIAVCDAFDAMTSDRPYQPAVSVDDALEELRRCAGGQFDPLVVHAFCAEAESLLDAKDSQPAPEVFEEAWTLAPPEPLLPDGVEAVDEWQHDAPGHQPPAHGADHVRRTRDDHPAPALH